MLEGILLSLIVFSVLAFGGETAWAMSLAQAGLVVLFGLWLIRLVWTTDRRLPRTGLVPPVLVLLAVGGLQLVPLPPGVVARVSPAAAAELARGLPGYGDGGPVDFGRLEEWLGLEPAGVVEWLLATPEPSPVPQDAVFSAARPLSLHPHVTAGRVIMMATLLMGFLAATHLTRLPPRRQRLVWAAILLGLAASILGIAQSLQWNGKIWWIQPPPEGALPFGPFADRDRFGAFMGMCLPLSIGMGFGIARRDGALSARAALSGFCAAAMIAALALSGSRAAPLALAASAAVYLGALAWRSRSARLAGAAAASLGLAAILMAVHLAAGLPAVSRPASWARAILLIADYPLTGCGLGAFPDAWIGRHPAGAPATPGGDLLRIAPEAGAVGALAVAWGIALLVGRHMILDPRRHPPAAPEAPVRHGIAVGLLAVLVMALLKDGLLTVGIGLSFGVLSAIMVAGAPRPAEG